MRSIGGDLETDPAWVGGPPTVRTTSPASGRGALFQILRSVAATHANRTIALPDYICESVIRSVEASGFSPRFYRIDDALQIDRSSVDEALENAAAMIVVSYFGLVDVTADIAHARSAKPGCVIIKDDVHAYWDVGTLRGADYAFTSLRKTFPVPDGTVIHPSVTVDLEPGRTSTFSVMKFAAALLKHARKRASVDDAAFLELFRVGEERLEDAAAYRAATSWMTEAILAKLDINEIAARRRANFRVLEAAIAQLGLRSLVALAGDAVPLVLPVRLRNRDAVRRALAREQVFCPVHWPIPRGHAAAVAHAGRLYESELSLIVDQRYDERDMIRIAKLLKLAGAAPSDHSSIKSSTA